jgi:hypothetical protein
MIESSPVISNMGNLPQEHRRKGSKGVWGQGKFLKKHLLLDSISIVIDAAVHLADDEERSLDLGAVERVNQGRSPLVWTIVEGDSHGL